MGIRGEIDKVKDEEVRKQLHQVQDVRDQLHTDEPAEAKKIRGLIESTSDKDLREALQDRLDNLESQSTVDVGQAVQMVQDMGYNVIDVLNAGLGKYQNSRKAAAIRKQEDEAKGKDAKASKDDGKQAKSEAKQA